MNKQKPITGYRTMTGAQRYNARMERLFETAREQQRQHAPLHMLVRIVAKVKRANAIQHSGGIIGPEDWSELYFLQNEAESVIQEAMKL